VSPLHGMSLSGRTALVTGGASGIGLAICEDLTALGASVIIADRNLEAAQKVARQLAHTVAVDVELSDPESVEQFLRTSLIAETPIDILVSNASVTILGRFVDSDPSTWDEQWQVNLRSPMRLAHALAPAMASRQWGRLVFVSSDSARVGSTGEAVYAACKAGLFGVSKTMARELGRTGVTCNVVCPGIIDTPTTQANLDVDPKLITGLTGSIPLKRIGKPEEVSGLVALLCTDRGAYITGQSMSVSGGITMI
jgi:2-hydroxycyclohexanecarboxyl-CoA dehydrogenase